MPRCCYFGTITCVSIGVYLLFPFPLPFAALPTLTEPLEPFVLPFAFVLDGQVAASSCALSTSMASLSLCASSWQELWLWSPCSQNMI